MKIITTCKSALVIAVVLFNGAVWAYSSEDTTPVCKKPKFNNFNLAEYKAPERKEVAPESELSFVVSSWVDPSTIKLMAKRHPLDFTVESNSSFHRVKAKLPAALTGQFVRIDASARAVLGCDEQDGWLVKIAQKTTAAAENENSAETADSAEKVEKVEKAEKAEEVQK